METLDLSHMRLEYMPDLSDITKESVCLDMNDMGVIFSENLPPRIKHISLKSNRIYNDGIPIAWPGFLETIVLDNNFIQDTEGIEWPLGLKKLSLDSNPITTWPRVPSSLTTLSLNKTDIVDVDVLPENLQNLYVRGARVRQLPTTLPQRLEILSLENNFLRSNRLPFEWGVNLVHLNLSKNYLTRFPRGLPDSLKVLALDYNNITEVPSQLPANLEVLFLRQNKIRTIVIEERRKPMQIVYLDDNELTVSVSDYQLTKNVQWTKTITETENWNTEHHGLAVNRIRKLWKAYIQKKRLRTWKKTSIVRDELHQTSMHPSRAGRFENISTGWGYGLEINEWERRGGVGWGWGC